MQADAHVWAAAHPIIDGAVTVDMAVGFALFVCPTIGWLVALFIRYASA